MGLDQSCCPPCLYSTVQTSLQKRKGGYCTCLAMALFLPKARVCAHGSKVTGQLWHQNSRSSHPPPSFHGFVCLPSGFPWRTAEKSHFRINACTACPPLLHADYLLSYPHYSSAQMYRCSNHSVDKESGSVT